MYETAFAKIAELASRPESVEKSVQYLEVHIRKFLRKRERVLICFSEDDGAICHIFERAVRRSDGIPLLLGEDRRWKTILKIAFANKCNAIIGPPLMVLGLSKAARYMGTPLYTRNVLLAGYPCMEWMVEGIQRGLDCKVWGCYDPGVGAVVAGFSCGKSVGVHLRTEEYGVDIVDGSGVSVPPGTVGNVFVYPVSDPELRFDTSDRGKLETAVCPCGCTSPRLQAIAAGKYADSMLSKLGEELHRWTSILDCRLEECGYGLELEMVVFPGEKLPKLPSFAKMVIRPWDLETDEPFPHTFIMKNRHFSEENH